MLLTRGSVLTRYMPRRKIRKVKSLLAGAQEEETEEEVVEEEVRISSVSVVKASILTRTLSLKTTPPYPIGIR